MILKRLGCAALILAGLTVGFVVWTYVDNAAWNALLDQLLR